MLGYVAFSANLSLGFRDRKELDRCPFQTEGGPIGASKHKRKGERPTWWVCTRFHGPDCTLNPAVAMWTPAGSLLFSCFGQKEARSAGMQKGHPLTKAIP